MLKVRYWIVATFLIIVCFNNFASMILFTFEEYLRKNQVFALDVFVTIIFVMEFFYIIVTQPSPRIQLAKNFDTYVDLVTMITPFMAHYMNTLCPDVNYSEYEIDYLPELSKYYECFNSRST